MRIKNRLQNMSLREKLIVAFACFIIVPIVIIGGTLSWLFVRTNQSMILDAALENNRQIVRNIDTSLAPLLRLSTFPVQNNTLFQLIRKDYDAVPYPLYEKTQAFNVAGDIIRKSIMLYSDLIDSAVIHQSKNHLLLGRSNYDYLNQSYLEHGFYNEPFIQSILQQNGKYVATGIHEEKLLSVQPVPVVSIGRAVVDPFTKEKLGFILFNIEVEKLKTLWSDIQFTSNTRFYLVDQNSNVIYSKDESEIGKPASALLGQPLQAVSIGEGEQLHQDKDQFLITVASSLSGWRTVTVIPKNELFGFVNTIVRTIVVSLCVLLGLAIAVSIYIATGVTRPLLQLERKMKLVAQGDLNVSIDIQHGEIGKIGVTIDQMLEQIRRLIQAIYEEEKEKRKSEILALQSQIRPHFMYNTLNSIRWMAKMQGATGIEEALTAFSSVIQFTAKTKGDLVSVREEIAFIRNYTQILDIRYLGKFNVIIDVEPDIWDYRILKFMLQPLVENAIFHGFDEIPYKGKLEIRIYEEAGDIVLKVTDNGRGMSSMELERLEQNENKEHLNAIGIHNIRKRIELHFGKSYGLTIHSTERAGTTATIVVPVIEQAPAGEPK